MLWTKGHDQKQVVDREERTQLPRLKQQLSALPSLQRHHCCHLGSLAPPKCSLKDVKTVSREAHGTDRLRAFLTPRFPKRTH